MIIANKKIGDAELVLPTTQQLEVHEILIVIATYTAADPLLPNYDK